MLRILGGLGMVMLGIALDAMGGKGWQVVMAGVGIIIFVVAVVAAHNEDRRAHRDEERRL